METWTDLSDPVAHTKAPAAWGLGILNNQKLLKRMYPYTGIARRVANQNIPDNALTAISFDTEYLDEANYFDISGAPTHITIPYKGRYAIEIGVTFGPSGVGVRKAQLWLNGALDEEYVIDPVAAAGENTFLKWNFSTAQRQAGSYYELRVYQNYGGVLIAQARISIRCLLNEN